MSVNAISPADQQQKGNKTGAAIGGGVVLGATGATIGYITGNKRPSLEELLKNTDKDAFTKQEVTNIDAEAAKKLADAKEEYKAAGATERAAYTAKSKELAQSVSGKTVEQVLTTAVTDKQAALDAKKVKINDVEKTYKQVVDEVKAATQNVKNLAANADEATRTAATARLQKAKEEFKAFQNGAEEEIKALRDAKVAVQKAKIAKFGEEAAKDGTAEKTLKDAVADLKGKFTEAKSNKMTELLTDDLKAAFDKVKSAFPKKGGLKKAGIYGGIAAAAGALGGILLGGGKKEA